MGSKQKPAYETRLWDPNQKKLVSKLNKTLITALGNPLEIARTNLGIDIPSLLDDSQKNVRGDLYNSLISTRHTIVYFMIIYRIYINPLRLKVMGRDPNANCPKCQAPNINSFPYSGHAQQCISIVLI